MHKDYCEVLQRESNEPDIVVVGPKPGEKMYEELMNSEEVRRTKELENYFV